MSSGMGIEKRISSDQRENATIIRSDLTIIHPKTNDEGLYKANISCGGHVLAERVLVVSYDDLEPPRAQVE